MTVEIKICGLRTPETLEAALYAGADMVGFVFFPHSPRHVNLSEAGYLGKLATGRAKKVALIVDANNAEIEDIIETLRPDILQLHGHETPNRIAEIRQHFGCHVMKALGISSAADLERVSDYAAVSDWLLFDAKPPKVAALPGGNGVVFDWNLLIGLDVGKPFMVSGGLEPSNVASALSTTSAMGVDVSSGVESAPGIKSLDRIFAFIEAARQADAAARMCLRKDQNA